MARGRELLVNIERVRREMDEFFGDSWAPVQASGSRRSSFTPRVDVYYERAEGEEGGQAPVAVVKADLAGIEPDAVSLEISGRELVISGSRPARQHAGRAYQQIEIATGPFRRVIQLGADVVAERATATFDDGMLRIELPIRVAEPGTRKVPIERAE